MPTQSTAHFNRADAWKYLRYSKSVCFCGRKSMLTFHFSSNVVCDHTLADYPQCHNICTHNLPFYSQTHNLPFYCHAHNLPFYHSGQNLPFYSCVFSLVLHLHLHLSRNLHWHQSRWAAFCPTNQ